MKKDDVMLGGEYAVKVNGQIVCVVVEDEHPAGGWVGTNQKTGKQVRIKSAQRLRGWWDDYLKGGDEQAHTPPQGDGAAEDVPKVKEPMRRAPRAKPAPTCLASTDRSAARQGGRMSGLDAAAKVLEEAGGPLDCRTIVERAFEKGYWHSDGKTPAATLYAAILRDIRKYEKNSRFVKAGPGKFASQEHDAEDKP